MTPNTQYIVTKPSNDGSFLFGDKFVLKDDGRIWIGDDYIDFEDISLAIIGMEYELLTTTTPNHLKGVALEMYELLQQVATSTNSGYGSMRSAAALADTLRDLSSQAKQLMAKIEGGGE